MDKHELRERKSSRQALRKAVGRLADAARVFVVGPLAVILIAGAVQAVVAMGLLALQLASLLGLL